ncbi:Probable 2-oxoglutarate-dependent dioxygenase AOP1.2 [Linum grandiflorum]
MTKMGSQGPSLPVIDFSNLDVVDQAGNEEWESVRSQVWKAAEEYGCFKVKCVPTILMPSEITQGIMSGVKELFDFPVETLSNNVSAEPFGGYIGKSAFAPLYESVGIVNPHNSQKVEDFVSLFWPAGNPNLSETIKCFAEKATELERTIGRMILESIGLEKYLNEYVESVIFNMRGIRYEAPFPCPENDDDDDDDAEAKLGLDSHMDQGLTALLYGNHVNGLEIQTKDGQWFVANYSDDSFIVILGESLHAWTNGRVYSPYHRVRLDGKERRRRYTFGMFSGFKQGYTVKAPEELVDEQHPLLYTPFDFNKFLELRLEETHKAYNSSSTANYSPIKAYFAA